MNLTTELDPGDVPGISNGMNNDHQKNCRRRGHDTQDYSKKARNEETAVKIPNSNFIHQKQHNAAPLCWRPEWPGGQKCP